MPFERLAGRRFQADAIVEPRLLGERLEQCGHAADPVAVQILDAVGAIADRRRIGAEGEAVADEQNGLRLGRPRSEEHTSELQSLMRISYAVFCLKKKKKQK